MTEATTPAGYWRDAQGRLVPEGSIRPIDRTRDQLVREIVAEAKLLSAELKKFKQETFQDIAAFIDLSAEQYGVKVGGTKGNVTLMSFDGRYKVVRHYQDSITFDERLQAAKKLIDDCIQLWSDGSRSEIKVLINDAFQVDKEGRINTGRILALRRIDIADDKWKQAMQAIGDSVQVSFSKAYVRFYERVGDSEEFKPLSLDVATL